MSDGTPRDVASDAQLDRIRRDVLRRIDDRRRLRRRVAGGVVALVLVVGGFGGLLRAAGGAASGGSTAAGSSSERAVGRAVAVRCETGSAPGSRVRVSEADLPDSALDACGAEVDFQSGGGRMPTAEPSTPSPSSTAAEGGASPGLARSAVLCEAVDGALAVLPLDGSAAASCARLGLRAWTR